MRGQVPPYLIIGNGRMARHLCHYLDLLHISYQRWHRQLDTPFAPLTTARQTILLLINDAAIVPFIETHPQLQAHRLIHFSGSLYTPLAIGAHPLMSFSTTLYTRAEYEKIPFMIDQPALSAQNLLGLPNPSYYLQPQQKPLYHTLCVLANNLTTLLWQKFFSEMDNKFHIDKTALLPYLQRTFINLSENHQQALTGPLSRNDHATLATNLRALENDPYQNVLQAFIHAYQESQESIDEHT